MTGVVIPPYEERAAARREGREHVSVSGYLQVPCASSLDPSPHRDGWEPFFVSVNLAAEPPAPKMWVSYRNPKP